MSRTEPTTPTSTPSLRPTPRQPGGYIPWIVLGIATVYLLAAVGRMNPPSKPYDLESLARLPVVDGGRVKPLETFARINLRIISQRENFVDDAGNSHPAIRWYIDVVAGGGREARGKAWKYRVFRIENDQLLSELGLKPREGLRYSLEELSPNLNKIIMKGEMVERRKESRQPIELVDEKMNELYRRLKRFFAVAEEFEPLVIPPKSAGEDWLSIATVRADTTKAALAGVLAPILESLSQPERLAKLTQEQRNELLIRLGGFVTPPTEPAIVEKRLRELFREKTDTLSAEELQRRLLAIGEVLTDEERATVMTLAEQNEARRMADNPAVMMWKNLIDAYRDGNSGEFNNRLGEYWNLVRERVPASEVTRSRLESYYNRFAPFYHCTVLYVLVFALCCFSWLGRTEPLRKSAFYLLYLTLLIHTGALIARMYFQDRWSVFVTNLYSSAVFIGWGCVVLGLILEKLYPMGIGNTVASVLGVATAIISHNLNLNSEGDNMEMMRAVLDTNFWLSTHVTTVTFGYTATFVAGFIGIAFVARMLATVIRDSFVAPGKASPRDLLVFGIAAFGLMAIPTMLISLGLRSAADFEVLPSFLADILAFLVIAAGVVYALALLFVRATAENVDAHGNPVPGHLPRIATTLANLSLNSDVTKKLTQMIYGVVCFATLLSFVGTVLGGIWADQSWGRFWGWDPKENGAVLIVIWNALILHARWCGLVRDRGLAVLAIAGNMVTAWSWFGTNQLGIGLHAYGFNEHLAVACRWFWVSQLVIIGLGLIPRTYWASAGLKPAPAESQWMPSTTPASDSQPDPNTAMANRHETVALSAKGKRVSRRR